MCVCAPALSNWCYQTEVAPVTHARRHTRRRVHVRAFIRDFSPKSWWKSLLRVSHSAWLGIANMTGFNKWCLLCAVSLSCFARFSSCVRQREGKIKKKKHDSSKRFPWPSKVLLGGSKKKNKTKKQPNNKTKMFMRKAELKLKFI